VTVTRDNRDHLLGELASGLERILVHLPCPGHI
jgi:hypothetical protein